MNRYYQIGRVVLSIEMPKALQIPENMKLFEISENQANVKGIQRKYSLEVVDEFPKAEELFYERFPKAKVIEHPDLKILYTADQECRMMRFAGDTEAYAIYLTDTQDVVQIWIHEKVVDMLYYDTIFLSMFGLEKEMIRDSSMIFHSAYIMKNGKAILFSAPSETGKSTQASLWEKYRGAKVVNGDRSLLIREAGVWQAYGWPICGSSEICCNESYSIQAIVMLHQSKENVIRRLSGAEAVKKVLSQMMVNMWNTDFVMTSLDLVQQLVMEVPVFELGCDISEDAVKCVESVL